MPSTSVPVTVIHRPFSVYPPTNLMNPDGFFITNMGNQYIEVNIENESNDILKDVRVYIEGFSDPNIAPSLEYHEVGNVPAQGAFPVRFLADFKNALPGNTYISFIVESMTFEFKRIIKKIFVTKLEFDRPNKTTIVHAPEGKMLVKIHDGIVNRKHSPECKKPDPEDSFIFLPTHVSFEWIPDPGFRGKHGPLPFEDPWWKILVFIAVFLAVLCVALLYDYFSDGTLDGGSVSVSGGDIPPTPSPDDYSDETSDDTFCCEDIISEIPQKNDDISVGASGYGDWIEKGLYALAGPAALAAAGFADFEDPHYRGRTNTNPGNLELTTSERVDSWIKYPEAPSLGSEYEVGVKWHYTRETLEGSHEYGVEEIQKNIHFLKSYDVVAPEMHDRRTGPLTIKSRFQKLTGKYYFGDELYVFGVLVSTYGAVRFFPMRDHGMGLDEKAKDTWYTGGYSFERKIKSRGNQPDVDEDLPGDWYLFVFAQDTNTALESMQPVDAAKIIGGLIVTPQMNLRFNSPCTLEYDAIIRVV